MNRKIPIIRRTYLADGSILQSVMGSTLPGSKKLQFPFEIPTIETKNEVIIPKETGNILITTASIIGGGFLLGTIIKQLTK